MPSSDKEYRKKIEIWDTRYNRQATEIRLWMHTKSKKIKFEIYCRAKTIATSRLNVNGVGNGSYFTLNMKIALNLIKCRIISTHFNLINLFIKIREMINEPHYETMKQLRSSTTPQAALGK